MITVTFRLKGGAGSGNFGHSGRPGKIGGSSGGGYNPKYSGNSVESTSNALESVGWDIRSSELVDGDIPGVKVAKVQTKWKSVQDMTGAMYVGANRARLTVIGNSALLTFGKSDGKTISIVKSIPILSTGGKVYEASQYANAMTKNSLGEVTLGTVIDE